MTTSTTAIIICTYFSLAADTLDVLGFYNMDELADFRPPVQFFNPIRHMAITETNRVICYNQIIYGDGQDEEDEYFSLTLTVQDRSFAVDSQYSISVIRIVDDDGRKRLIINLLLAVYTCIPIFYCRSPSTIIV